MPKLDLTKTESLLVVARNRIDHLTAVEVSDLRRRTKELEARIEEFRAQEAKLQRETLEGWDEALGSVAKARGLESIPEDAKIHASDSGEVTIEWLELDSVDDVIDAIRAVVPDAEVTAVGGSLPFPAELESVGFEREIGPFPRTPLSDGVAATIAYFRRQG